MRRNQIWSFTEKTSPFKSAGARQFSRLLAAEVCASAVVMLDTSCSEVVWRVLATNFIRQFPLDFPSRESPCAITFQLDSTSNFSTLLPLFIPAVSCYKWHKFVPDTKSLYLNLIPSYINLFFTSLNFICPMDHEKPIGVQYSQNNKCNSW